MANLSAQERVKALEALLGFAFPDPALPIAAITHKSYVNEHKETAGSDNERLEFLGDAVVDLAVSHRLMEQFPAASEGELTRRRALIVNEDGLARVSRAMGLGDLLLLGRGEELTGGREKNSVLANALEAVIGAVYLAGGLPTVLALVDKRFADALSGAAGGLDYKTRLQEMAQENLKLAPRYKLIAESGPDHAKQFEVEVTIGDKAYARASGRSKKEAEQAAAQKALHLLVDPASG